MSYLTQAGNEENPPIDNTPNEELFIRGMLMKSLITLKDDKGKFVVSTLGLTTPETMQALIDFIQAYGDTRELEGRISEVESMGVIAVDYPELLPLLTSRLTYLQALKDKQ